MKAIRFSVLTLLLALNSLAQADTLLCKAFCLKLSKEPGSLVKHSSLKVESAKPISIRIESSLKLSEIKSQEVQNRLNQACGEGWIPSAADGLDSYGMILGFTKYDVCRKQDLLPIEKADSSSGDASS